MPLFLANISIFDALGEIVGAIRQLWTMFGNIFSYLRMSLMYFSESVYSITLLADFVPEVIGTCMVIVVVLAVLKGIFGR